MPVEYDLFFALAVSLWENHPMQPFWKWGFVKSGFEGANIVIHVNAGCDTAPGSRHLAEIHGDGEATSTAGSAGCQWAKWTHSTPDSMIHCWYVSSLEPNIWIAPLETSRDQGVGNTGISYSDLRILIPGSRAIFICLFYAIHITKA